MNPSRIIIAGAGVIGLCTAYYALKRGHAVTVVERDAEDGDNCSTGNAGMIVPSHFIPLAAVKESSTDARRMAGIREVCGDRVALGVGVDDCALEGFAMGAKFWITGVGDAFPAYNVRLLELGVAGRIEEAMPIYQWMLPMLRMDTVVKFVQLIKLQQALATDGKLGNTRVRPPRLELEGAELAEATAIIRHALATAPAL